MARLRQSLIMGPMLVALCIGCQPQASTVSGTITLDGKSVALEDDARGTVVFQPGNGQGAMATGVLDRIGHFTLSTGATPEVRPGKYQVTVSIVQLLPRTDDAPQTGKLMTPAKYGSAIDSGLQADVAPGENDFTFNLVSETVEEAPGSPESTAPASEIDTKDEPQKSQEI